MRAISRCTVFLFLACQLHETRENAGGVWAVLAAQHIVQCGPKFR
jgi:hypothetical protein